MIKCIHERATFASILLQNQGVGYIHQILNTLQHHRGDRPVRSVKRCNAQNIAGGWRGERTTTTTYKLVIVVLFTPRECESGSTKDMGTPILLNSQFTSTSSQARRSRGNGQYLPPPIASTTRTPNSQCSSNSHHLSWVEMKKRRSASSGDIK